MRLRPSLSCIVQGWARRLAPSSKLMEVHGQGDFETILVASLRAVCRALVLGDP